MGSTISGIGLYSYITSNQIETQPKGGLTINSLKITPGLEQDPSMMYGLEFQYNFSYTIHMNVTLVLNETVKAVPTCLLAGMEISSPYWYQFPVIYMCPALSNTPITYKAGAYNTSIIGEVMSNTSIPVFPSNLNIKVTAGAFNISSPSITLTLMNYGIQYIYFYNVMINSSTPLANGSVSYVFNASFYYMSEKQITISSSDFNLIVNSTSTDNLYYTEAINLWSFETLSSSPSTSVTLGPGGAKFNITTRLVDPNGNIYFNKSFHLPQLPVQITYNLTNTLSNPIELPSQIVD